MLTHIHIRDLATIEELHLHLKPGCTMITGETGAGKSIFIEAIELTLGGRASQNIIRAGKEKAEISLCFDVTDFPTVIDQLKQHDLDQDTPECIIRRVLTSDGRSRCYVNGSPATLNFVKELGEDLFHLHSQHEQQVLLKADTQREMLDRYADHTSLTEEVKRHALRYRELDQAIQTLQAKSLEGLSKMEYLRFQLDELEALNLKPGEWETLEAEHYKLTHAEELMRNIQTASSQVTNEHGRSLLALLNDFRKTLETIQPLEKQAFEWVTIVNTIIIQLSDLASELENYLTRMELDPLALQTLDAKVSQIFSLSRKHKVPPEELAHYQNHLASELGTLNQSDETLEALRSEQKATAVTYQASAARLTASRKDAANKLEKEMVETIRSLSLPHGEFKILIEQDESSFSIHGNEKIIFLIKTNPDQALMPLAKAISGGELSRLSLAAHLALASRTNIPTLIFDEVDTGLSGATAEKIGKLLRKLGQTYQVFCITHQAQVAALGHHHVLVEKYFIDQTTHTRLRLLNPKDKTQEIARMLGGEKITQKTLAHAREMLALA